MSNIQILSRARPIRIAYFVEMEEASHPILDAIFQLSYELWGGRFSLIVPCRSGQPVAAYLPWLQAFDADILYAYVDLDLNKQRHFHELYYPTILTRHPTGGSERRDFVPQLVTMPLSMMTIVPLAGAPNWIDGTRGTQILGAMGSLADDRFLNDSFGIASPSLRNATLGLTCPPLVPQS